MLYYRTVKEEDILKPLSECSDEEKEKLCNRIEAELGISRERQRWYE